MRTWRALPDERLDSYSPIGLQLVDETTGGPPIGRTEALLDVQQGAGWRETDVAAVRTGGGVLAYPGLGRRADVAQPARRYRVRIRAELYRPLYRALQDGLEFDAWSWNDTHPPPQPALFPQKVDLAPAPGYPFPPHVPVLRGRVVGSGGEPVADAEVMVANLERVLTDERGEFALPMRFTTSSVSVLVDAMHQRSGRVGNVTVTLPAALGQSQTIPIL